MGWHCDKLVDSGRRKFLTGASIAAVGAAASAVVPGKAKAATSPRAGHLSVEPAGQSPRPEDQ